VDAHGEFAAVMKVAVELLLLVEFVDELAAVLVEVVPQIQVVVAPVLPLHQLR